MMNKSIFWYLFCFIVFPKNKGSFCSLTLWTWRKIFAVCISFFLLALNSICYCEYNCFQVEIQNKLKDAHNVIEILSGIIGDSSKRDKEDSPKDAHRKSSDKTAGEKFNYIHYDPEVHWCRICDVFPRTAKDFLMHLHSKEHKKLMQDENIENPWHKLPKDPEFPIYDGASKKRLPIKGT